MISDSNYSATVAISLKS